MPPGEALRADRTFATEMAQMFDRIAPQYDLLNRLNSLGLDRRWRSTLVRKVVRRRPHHILDMATGTGDVAIALARSAPETEVIGMDLSEEMMAIGRTKVTTAGLSDRVTLRRGDALGIDLPDASVDVVTCAFGVRNFASIIDGYREFARVLRPGGMVAVLELTEPSRGLMRRIYRLYADRYLRRMARHYSDDPAAYDYLLESVTRVPARGEMLALMEKAGLTRCRYRIFFPGVCGLYVGEKREG